MKSINPDPKKYAIRIRDGKPILVDRQIISWRKARRKARALAKAKNIAEIKEGFDKALKMPLNLFDDL